jgi:hypothetical protein
MAFDVLLTDGSTETVEADGYAPEGPLTTFFAVDPGRPPRLDSWSVKLLSVRTDRIAQIRRTTAAPALRLLALAE